MDGAFEAMRPLPHLRWTMMCQSEQVNEHAVMALLIDTKSVASDVKHVITIASQCQRHNKDRTSTLSASTIRKNGGFGIF